MITDSHRIYFDISDLFEYAKHGRQLSGIQRVTLRLIASIIAHQEAARVSLIAYHPDFERVLEVDSSWCREDYSYVQSDFTRTFGLHLRTLSQYLSRYKTRPIHYLFHLIKIILFAVISNNIFFQKRHLLRPFRKLFPYTDLLKPLQLYAGDQIVILGATWGMGRYMEFLRKSHSEGVNIALLVHDVIPLVVPHFVVDDVPRQFAEWLRGMSDVVQRFITNSNATAADLSRQLAVIAPGRSYNITPVPLAHEFVEESSAVADPIRAHVLSAARLPYVLMVGTLESRKNIWGLANVWKQVIDNLGLGAPRLVFVGKHGWLKEDFDDFPARNR